MLNLCWICPRRLEIWCRRARFYFYFCSVAKMFRVYRFPLSKSPVRMRSSASCALQMPEQRVPSLSASPACQTRDREFGTTHKKAEPRMKQPPTLPLQRSTFTRSRTALRALISAEGAPPPWPPVPARLQTACRPSVRIFALASDSVRWRPRSTGRIRA